MQTISNRQDLKQAILFLENKQAQERVLLAEKLREVQESLKPMNIIKGVFTSSVENESLGENLVNSAIGIATGFVSRKLLVGRSRNPLKKLLGTVVQLGISKIVASHPDGIKTAGAELLKKLLGGARNRMRKVAVLDEEEPYTTE